MRSRGGGFERLLLKSFFVCINISADKRRSKDNIDGKEFSSMFVVCAESSKTQMGGWTSAGEVSVRGRV